jgi:hypothetical protein
MNNPIILERGYNTSGLYAFLTSMFYSRSDSVNKILNMDGEDIGVSYVQEFLKESIIGRFQMNRSVPVCHVNRFRNLLFNFGWRRDHRHNLDQLLADTDPSDVYRFLFIKGMQNRLVFERVEPKENRVDEVSFDGIEIGSDDLVFSDSNKPVINLSSSIRRWIQRNVADPDSHDYSYRFKELPYLIPVFIDPHINDTDEKDRVPIDIKEAIGFQSLNDPVQKIFTWDIQSIVLYDDEMSEFYSLVKNDGGEWEIVSQSKLPANRSIDMSDPNTINKIARQIRTIFYKIK